MDISKMKFKVGDKVRVIDDSWRYHDLPPGRIVEITEITDRNGSHCYVNECAPKSFKYFTESDIQHVRVADTKITRKLYKNKIHKIEEGWIYLNE